MLPTSVPAVQLRTSNQTGAGKKRKRQSWLSSGLEFGAFLIWLGITGYAGYWFGYDPAIVNCPSPAVGVTKGMPIAQEIIESARMPPCQEEEEDSSAEAVSASESTGLPPIFKEGGYTFNELKAMWECSHAVGEVSQDQLFPKGVDLSKTKWKSIISVEPKAFVDKYLMQYPGDMRVVQPVVVFSHKPLEKFEEISDVCKVLDIAIVPDKPGVCVAVTETYHDVASYHMLHADRQADGSFSLTSNFVDGRTLPDEAHYSAARGLLLDFFQFGEQVNAVMKEVPRFGKGKVVVACVIEDAADVELFLNSLQSAKKIGINKNKFIVFTTSSNEQLLSDLKSSGVKVLALPYLEKVGRGGGAGGVTVTERQRRFFIQTWLAFACANDLIKVMWQTPATIWFERPDNVVSAFPAVETQWAFKGRQDGRAAPFFSTFDFFVAVGVERPVHLLHELLLHFDLVLAWDSLDAVSAYRLSENNSRYVISPHFSELFLHISHDD